jgi:hypothetical protein
MSSDTSQIQDQPVPTPPGSATQNRTDLSPATGTVTGATRADSKELQSYIEMVEDTIKEETNPVRRQNAEVCLEFVKQNGYPAHGYRFLIHRGVMEVLKQDEFNRRTDDLARQIPGCLRDAFGLVCLLAFSSLSRRHSGYYGICKLTPSHFQSSTLP